jgi:hypothetical protein
METLLAQKSKARKRQQDQSEQAKGDHLSEGRSEGAAAGMPLYLQGGQAPLAPVPVASLATAEKAPVGKPIKGPSRNDPDERETDLVGAPEADDVVKQSYDLSLEGPELNSLGAYGRALGHDFRNVEVRVGDARGSGRGAFATVEGGRDVIAFDATSPSREQVAHELIHVAQRRRFGESSGGVAPRESAPEVEARELAERVVRRGRRRPRGALRQRPPRRYGGPADP